MWNQVKLPYDIWPVSIHTNIQSSVISHYSWWAGGSLIWNGYVHASDNLPRLLLSGSMDTLCVSEISCTINILGLFSGCQCVCPGRPEAHSQRMVLHTSPRWSGEISAPHSTPALSAVPWGMLGYAGFDVELYLRSTRKLFCHINNHTEKSSEAVLFEAPFVPPFSASLSLYLYEVVKVFIMWCMLIDNKTTRHDRYRWSLVRNCSAEA